MKKVVFFVVVALIVIPFVSSEILVGQPLKVYNIGDTISVPVTVKSNLATNDFLNIDLLCDGQSEMVYRNPFNLDANEEVTVNVVALISKSLIGDLKGNCKLRASYMSDLSESQSFSISDSLDVEIDFDEGKYNVGMPVVLTGTALKANGEPVSGFVELKIPTLDVSKGSTVNNGIFSIEFLLPDNALAGLHIVELRVYNEDYLGVTSNEELVSTNLEILQTLKKLEIKVDSQSKNPGDELRFTVFAIDQANNYIDDDITVTIYEPGDFVFLEKVYRSGEEQYMTFDMRNIPGYWKITAKRGDKIAKKLVYLEENPRIESSLINNTLIVTNTGNVRYEGPFDIKIGSSNVVKQVELKVGESKKFKLNAPDGTYLVSVGSGLEEIPLGNVFLTGNAIKITDIRDGILGKAFNPMLYIFIIVVFISIIVVFQTKRMIKKKKDSKIMVSDRSFKRKGGEILHGIKESASVIAIKVPHSNNKFVNALIESGISVAKSSGSKTYDDGDYKIAVFSKHILKNSSPEQVSVETARKIEELFKNHNAKSKDKVKFGIGVNRGEIISEKNLSDFKFTTTGNIVSLAKRIASGLDGEVLLSDSLRRNVMNNIKTEKIHNKEEYRIIYVKDRSVFKGFLDKFKHKS